MGAKPRAFKHWLGPQRILQIAEAIADAIELLINGKPSGSAEFELVD